MKNTGYEKREDGIYLDGEKVAHVVAGGHIRMGAGKSDLRAEVEHFFKTGEQPAPAEPAEKPLDPVEPDGSDGFQFAPAAPAAPASPAPASPAAPAAPAVPAAPGATPPAEPPVIAPAPAVVPRQPTPPAERTRQTPPTKPAPERTGAHPDEVGTRIPRPEEDPAMGDKTPEVVNWYRDQRPDLFNARYGHRRLQH